MENINNLHLCLQLSDGGSASNFQNRKYLEFSTVKFLSRFLSLSFIFSLQVYCLRNDASGSLRRYMETPDTENIPG